MTREDVLRRKIFTEFEGSVKVDCAAERTGYDASASSSGQSPVVANSAVLEAALAAACDEKFFPLSKRSSLPELKCERSTLWPLHRATRAGQSGGCRGAMPPCAGAA